MSIPKILCQTSRTPLARYVNAMWRCRMSVGWEHHVFNNDQQRQFLIDNQLSDFPNLVALYDSLTLGQHKSDIFRFMYLYLNGGVYVDSDTMTNTSLDELIEDYDAVFTINNSFVEGNNKGLPVFGPFVAIGAFAVHPNSIFIYKLLKLLDGTTPTDFDQCYLIVGTMLYDIVCSEKHNHKVKLLEEFHYDDAAITRDSSGAFVIKHYWKHTDIIPQDFSMPYEPDTTIVTAFYDIGRSEWDHFERSNDIYFESFGRLIQLQNDVIVYTGPSTYSAIKELSKNRPNVRVVLYDLINDQAELLSRISAIQKSPHYVASVHPDLTNNPEYTHPEYVLITTSKIELLRMSLPLTTTKNIAWVDFGQCRDADHLRGIVAYDSPYTDNKFHMNALLPVDNDDWHAAIFNNVVFADGSSLVGPTSRVEEFHRVYYKFFNKYLQQGVVDDDQSYFAMVAYYYKSLLEMHVTGKWFVFF